MNNEPIFSVLSGKILSAAPCNFGETNTGSCSGYCNITNYGTTRFETINSALSACEAEASGSFYNWNTGETLTNGNCLGAWTTPTGDPDSENLFYATCWS